MHGTWAEAQPHHILGGDWACQWQGLCPQLPWLLLGTDALLAGPGGSHSIKNGPCCGEGGSVGIADAQKIGVLHTCQG